MPNRFLRALAVFALMCAFAFGQGERATVTGLVTDPSGSILVGADLTIRNLATNVTTRTKSNAAGIYYLPALPPGKYELRAEQPGFRPSVVANLPLGVGLSATVDIKMELGTVSEAVQVEATQPPRLWHVVHPKPLFP